MRRLRLGIIGTGIATRDLHWPALRRLQDRFEIVALCNRTRSKAESFAELVGGNPSITTDYHELLAARDVEAVDISLPIVLNAPVTLEALAAGKHVLLEKPIAGDLQSAGEVVAAADDHPNLVLLVAENLRYEEWLLRARRAIDEGAIGRPILIEAQVLSPMDPSSPYAGTEWRSTPEHLGGYLSDGGVHQAAILHVLGGPIESVQGLITAFRPEDDPTDTLLANLRFASGAVGHITYSVGVRQGEPPSFRVYGTEGVLSASWKGITLRNADGESEIEVPNALSSYERELLDFYEAIANGGELQVSPRDAFADLALIDATFRSSQSGAEVHLSTP